MDDLTMYSALVGAGLPLLIAVINQPRWPGPARAIVTVLICVGVGAGTAWFSGALTGQRWLRAALIVGFAAVGTYQTLWRPSGIAPGIERATALRGDYRLAR